MNNWSANKNMQSGSGTKNPPWARSNVNTNMSGINPQIMDPNAMMTQQGIMPFQQSQTMFNPMQSQGGMAMPMAGQMPMSQMTQGQMYPGNVVAYPTPRAMNPNMYQNVQTNQTSANAEQRVFTGTVTKTHNDFGFIDHDVFYQISVCAKGVIPKMNDRVLVEATYNPNMPFKWNATRVQVLPKTVSVQKPAPSKSNSYNAVPPPSTKKPLPRRDDRPPRRDDRKRSRTRSRSRSRDRRDSRNRRDSPPRKRSVVRQPSPIKYVVRVPRMPLDIQKVDVPTLSQRYTNLYIPSDFFNAYVKWGEAFPPQAPFSLNNPCTYHIMNKDIENPCGNDAVLEPSDADYRFSAKVMLISMPMLETLYQKCGLTKSDEKEKRSNSSKSPLHPTRLIKFLVGQKGKSGENFAIGGPWSPSLDGENPESDPQVLVKTAIRTCKALTGIDLSSCTQWYRIVEFYYWREGSGTKSRLECVVLYLPDVWSAQSSRIEWSNVQDQYKAACDAAIRKLDGEQPASGDGMQTAEPSVAADKSKIEKIDLDDDTITIDENDDEDDKPEPTHYSKIDLKTLKVDQLRQELRARNVSCKGLRAQLVSRLSKLLKFEEEKEGKVDDIMELEDDEQELNSKKEIKEQVEILEEKNDTAVKDEDIQKIEEEESNDVSEKQEDTDKKEHKEEKKSEKEIEEEKKKIEKEKQLLRNRYELPSTQHIIVHPSQTAKGGKFTCSVATLSLLLDYRVTDNKEYSFELFVFAELFNEMLMRDFGFYIYKTLYTLPEKTEEVKDKSSEQTDKKEEKKPDDKDKKDEKRDDKRDSRRRDIKDSHNEEEGSGSPKHRNRGVDLPPDPYLLLALVYFDTSRCGGITKKDLQNLFMSLGLQLSRSQIRTILEKVCTKDLFAYKVLMQAIKDMSSGNTEAIQDTSLDNVTVISDDIPSHVMDVDETIAAGNRQLLPLFKENEDEEDDSPEKTKDCSKTGVVMYKSRLVDVGALVLAEARGTEERVRLEGALRAARAALHDARAAAACTKRAERGAQNQLSDLTANLAATRARVTSLMASSKIFHSALKSIQSKVEAVINIKYEDDDVEIINGPTESENQQDTSKENENSIENKNIDSAEKNVTLNSDKKESETNSEHTDGKEDIISSDNMEIDDKD